MFLLDQKAMGSNPGRSVGAFFRVKDINRQDLCLVGHTKVRVPGATIAQKNTVNTSCVLVLVNTQEGSIWSIVLRCDQITYHTGGIFTCNGCARDPYFYVPAETQSVINKEIWSHLSTMQVLQIEPSRGSSINQIRNICFILGFIVHWSQFELKKRPFPYPWTSSIPEQT